MNAQLASVLLDAIFWLGCLAAGGIFALILAAHIVRKK